MTASFYNSSMLKEHALNIYTDGSMLPSPRAGGIGIVFVIINDRGDAETIKQFERPGYRQSTNQEMELEACVVGLRDALDDKDLTPYREIEIFTDSKYVQGNYRNAMFLWPKTQWKNRSTGRPILHVDQWKNLVRLIQKAARDRRRVNINWIKGHKGNPYNKAADKAAKRSAGIPLNRPKSVVSVRRKLTKNKTSIGSVIMRGQVLLIRIITTQYLSSPHRLWKYKYEVISPESEYHGYVDEIFAVIALRDGHTYEVQLNDNTHNPHILELIAEIPHDANNPDQGTR